VSAARGALRGEGDEGGRARGARWGAAAARKQTIEFGGGASGARGGAERRGRGGLGAYTKSVHLIKYTASAASLPAKAPPGSGEQRVDRAPDLLRGHGTAPLKLRQGLHPPYMLHPSIAGPAAWGARGVAPTPRPGLVELGRDYWGAMWDRKKNEWPIAGRSLSLGLAPRPGRGHVRQGAPPRRPSAARRGPAPGSGRARSGSLKARSPDPAVMGPGQTAVRPSRQRGHTARDGSAGRWRARAPGAAHTSRACPHRAPDTLLTPPSSRLAACAAVRARSNVGQRRASCLSWQSRRGFVRALLQRRGAPKGKKRGKEREREGEGGRKASAWDASREAKATSCAPGS
jgi:hypothetical protein